MKLFKQFYLYKFDSSRIRRDNYKIVITPKEAEENEEIIASGDSQLFRTIREIKGRDFNPRDKKTMFIPEVISITIEKKAHYKEILKYGLNVNGIIYKRFLCGAGHARNNTVYFVAVEIFEKLNEIFRNGHKKDLIMNPAKYNAYFGLYASASKVVTTPRVAVVPDYKFKKVFKVDWIEKDLVTQEDKEIEVNAFDGQGLVSPQMSAVWSNNLELTYNACQFIIRAPFIKGMCCTFDFHELARKNHIFNIKDIWGDIVPINQVDVILSESQFKLWSAYENWIDYSSKCKKNNLTWGVTRTNPKKDKSTAFTNYQYLQTLKLDDTDIQELCAPTVDWLKDVTTDKNPMKAIMFLLGDKVDDIYELLSLKEMDIAKAVVLNNRLLNNPHIRNKIFSMTEKKIKESYMGKLAISGNYSIMMSDPYAQAEHSLGLNVTGLLKEREYFSSFWNAKGVTAVDSCRSPMTHYSEHNLLELKDSTEMSNWYKHLESGIVLNIFGDDCMRYADAD